MFGICHTGVLSHALALGLERSQFGPTPVLLDVFEQKRSVIGGDGFASVVVSWLTVLWKLFAVHILPQISGVKRHAMTRVIFAILTAVPPFPNLAKKYIHTVSEQFLEFFQTVPRCGARAVGCGQGLAASIPSTWIPLPWQPTCLH